MAASDPATARDSAPGGATGGPDDVAGSVTAVGRGGDETPRGRNEVVAALVDAAGRELAAKGVAGTSVRAVAAAAGVNHGLVHRHFGSKDAMVAAVLDDLAERIGARAGADPAWPFGTAAAGDDELLDRFWRVMARTILDGGDPRALQHDHPYMQGLVARLRDRGLHDDGARLVAAQAVALTLGWLLFEPFLEAAAGLDPRSRTVHRHALSAAASALVDSSEPGGATPSSPPMP